MRPLLTTMVLTVGLLAGASASTHPQAAPAIAWRKPDGAKVEATLSKTEDALRAAQAFGADAVLLVPCRIGGMKMPKPASSKSSSTSRPA